MKGYASDNLLRLQPDWLLVYEDEGSALFVKKGGSAATLLQHAAVGHIPAEVATDFP